jgi:A/G-specific adenine glycosylase
MKKESVLKSKETKANREKHFANELLHWNRYENNRQMPWKGEKDPYKIWLSEVILQQTRVEQGLKYYEAFVSAFPTVQALAKAPEAKVFKLWEGLGYYSRCRNIIYSARYIAKELNGVFPKDYESILSLKGVGSYTASAIASFAYNLPYAVLDGNVFRVLSRVFDIELPIDSTGGKKEFATLAQAILPRKQAGQYNQAIMDFGAIICKPVPLCSDCFFNKHCLAYLSGKQDLLPVKEKKTVLKKRWLSYFIVRCGNEVLVQQRTEKDIWKELYQFVLIETPKAATSKNLLALLEKQFGLRPSGAIKDWTAEQYLSHQYICFQFIMLQIKRKKKVEAYAWTDLNHLQKLAFPRGLQQAVQDIRAGYDQ